MNNSMCFPGCHKQSVKWRQIDSFPLLYYLETNTSMHCQLLLPSYTLKCAHSFSMKPFVLSGQWQEKV